MLMMLAGLGKRGKTWAQLMLMMLGPTLGGA